MRLSALLLFLLIPFVGMADDLSGIWKGTLTQGAGGCYPKYFLELQINFANNNITGRAFDYYDTSRFVKLSFKGRYNPQTKRMVLIESRVLDSNIPNDCAPCVKTYDLTYSRQGNDEMLTGDWKGHIENRKTICPPGKIVLKKATYSDFPLDIDQSDTLSQIQQSMPFLPRVKELVKTLLLDTSRISIEFYDDAVVDGDTISVFINNKLILYHQGLSEKPLHLLFTANPGAEYELVMYADNLGTLPPNTALMVVTAGARKYEVFLSSSEQKSAAVKFIYQPTFH